jgi:NAD+ diphosphatase
VTGLAAHTIGTVQGAAAITFSGAELDRAHAQRRRPEWVAQQLQSAGARALMLSEDGVWVEPHTNGTGLALARPATLGGEPVLLGLSQQQALFAVDVGGLETDGLPGRPAGIRELATELPERELGLAAYAAALLNWHRRHPFCAACGHATIPADAGHERHCPSCNAHHFPRTDPVVIMCVTRGEQLLLGHQAAWPDGRYSVLAGFVEPGETLEQAVRREVLEEAGVEVDEVDYVASQPWPFPSSLMLGFAATARGGPEPRADGHELQHVRWFGRDEVQAAARGESSLLLPPGLSIARRLIDAWL